MLREREQIEDDARAQRFHPLALMLEVLLDLRELAMDEPHTQPPFSLPTDLESHPLEVLAEISSLLQSALEANAQFQNQALELLTGIHHQLSVAPDALKEV